MGWEEDPSASLMNPEGSAASCRVTRPYSEVQRGLRYVVPLLPQPPEYRDYRCVMWLRAKVSGDFPLCL